VLRGCWVFVVLNSPSSWSFFTLASASTTDAALGWWSAGSAIIRAKSND
jgi:hypothetical protein